VIFCVLLVLKYLILKLVPGIDYAVQWYEKFGLVYYGCCEPLDGKIDIVREIPNLRKISMSPWVDFF